MTFNFNDGFRAPQVVHLYVAYWAPLTEGVISYTRTAGILVSAGYSGLKACIHRKFDRWMFGRTQWPEVKPRSFQMLLACLLGIAPLLFLVYIAAGVMNLAFGGHLSDWSYLRSHWPHIGIAVAIALVIAYPIHWARYFVVQYMRDVAIYVTNNEVNEFYKTREEIKKICADVARRVFGAVDVTKSVAHDPTRKTKANFVYNKIIVVGHSLGSVVAYDTLNAMIQEDWVNQPSLSVVDRTYAFITFGSPLDKTAFLFRQHVKLNFVREMMAASVQPMIQSYSYRPEHWYNIFCHSDIISGCLEYYDDQCDPSKKDDRRVRNYRDPYRSLDPIKAHTGYWGRQPTQQILYGAALNQLAFPEMQKFLERYPEH